MFSLRTFSRLISHRWTQTVLQIHGRFAPLRTLLSDPVLVSPLVLIYQMQKAGSQTLEATLREAGLPFPTFRFHFLSPARTAAIEQLKHAYSHPRWQQNQQHQLEMAARLRPVVNARKKLARVCGELPKVQILTGLREPIGCTLSWVFQNHFLFFPDVAATTLERAAAKVMNAEPLAFFQNWFDTELEAMTGIDVYQTPFPREQGYAIYENDFARVLVYRFEALKKLPAVLKDFLGHPIPELANRNVGRAKEYGSVYQQISRNLRFPADFVDAQYDSKMMRHFYSEEERAAFARRWTTGVPALT